ncbi:MAG: Pvc16 family protein [Sulfurifustis sp.]
MAVPSALSVAARALRTHLAGAVGLPESQILIGHPNQAVKDVEGEANKQFLNLFLYRIDYGAAPADGEADDPFFLRVYCLITALGTKETSGTTTISAGENDLRLVGGVMKRLHERPILMLQNDAAQDVAQLQVVLHALTLDDINHIWSTQGDTPYRLSVGYELALVPLPLAEFVDRAPRVGSIGVDAQSGIGYQPLPVEGFAAGAAAPQVPAVFVDSSRPDWTPHICWFAPNGTLQYSLSFEAAALPSTLGVIPLGKPGDTVQLEWETWDPAATHPSWQSAPATPPSVTLAADSVNPLQTVPAPSSLAQSVDFPLSARGQATLYASRSYTRPDGVVVKLRSNPLLISVHSGAGP